MVHASPRAFSYIRFSTPEQIKGDSLRRQLDLSAQYAKEHGLALDDKLTFRDCGVSAFDKSNLASGGKLREFLDAVDHGHVPPGSFLLVESLDRLSRAKIREAFRLFNEILDKGITIVTLADGMTYSPESDDSHRDFISLVVSLSIMSGAHEESVTKSRRLKAAWSAKRQGIDQKKLTCQCPAWLRLRADKTAYEPVPERVAVVRQIIDLVRSGQGKGAIAKRLNESGIPSIGWRNKDQTWFGSYVTKIVKSRALIGEFQPHRVEGGKRVPVGVPVRDYFPRVLSDEEFALLQDLISERGRKAGGNRGRSFSNLFTGIAKCGYCGSSMLFVDKGEDKRGNRSNRSNRFLVCHKAKRGAGCHYVSWVYADFEESFLNYATRVDFERFVKTTNDAGAELRSVNDKLIVERASRTDLIARRDRLVEAIAGGEVKPMGVVDKIAEIEDQIGECEARLKALDAQMEVLSTRQQMSEDALQALRGVADALRTKTGDELFLLRAKLNEHMRRVLDRIILFPGGRIETAAEVAYIKTELIATGRYSAEDIDKFVTAELYTAARKHERYFAIRNREKIIHVISPESAVPDILEVLERNPDFWREALRRARAKSEVAANL
jgi:DNA invertase Pin-like site-specific DNA recombinase